MNDNNKETCFAAKESSIIFRETEPLQQPNVVKKEMYWDTSEFSIVESQTHDKNCNACDFGENFPNQLSPRLDRSLMKDSVNFTKDPWIGDTSISAITDKNLETDDEEMEEPFEDFSNDGPLYFTDFGDNLLAVEDGKSRTFQSYFWTLVEYIRIGLNSFTNYIWSFKIFASL